MSELTKKHRLLIVDDDAAIRALLQRVALRAGFETETARDGQEAMEKLEYRLYDIVIVDLMMPRVSGFQLIENIAALQPRPTVIVTTALTNGDVARIDDSMIRRVIRKPFDLDTLATVLIETASEIADHHTITDMPPAVSKIILGDTSSGDDTAAQHAAAAANHAAAAADQAAAAADEAAKAAKISQTEDVSDVAAPQRNREPNS